MRPAAQFPPVPAVCTPVRLIVAALVFVLASCCAINAFAQTLASDLPDYPPGTIATLTGTGFEPGEEVHMAVHRLDEGLGAVERDWAWTSLADENGAFVTEWYVCDQCGGASLQATATGASSGAFAECFFTDATAWTVTISPNTSATNATQLYTLSALNTSTGTGNQMGCITIQIPSQFTPVGDPLIVPGSTTHAWTVGRVGNLITAVANSNGNRIEQGEGIQIQQSATAPASMAGSPFSWTCTARSNTNCTGNSFGIPENGSPTVSVTCSAPGISCPGNITVNNDPGQCSAVVSFAATGTGSPAPTVTYSHAPGSSFPVGTTTVTATATSSCGSASCSFTVTVVDNTAPSILLAGANPVTLECHGPVFADPGATASDNCPGVGIVSVSGAVDVNAVGSYFLTYNVTDAHGNSASASRTVNVVDTTDPLVTLNGPAEVTLECHGEFLDPGASANDACAGALAANASSNLDAGVVGDYLITYSASDPSGNSASVTRTIHVVDTTNPVVTLNGDAEMTLECHGAPFVDPGASAVDGCAGNLAVSVSGSVDVNTVGDYVLTYSAVDPSGNPASATRTVHVVDTTNPVVTLNGPADVTLECHGAAFSDPGATATDACAGDLAVSVSGSVDVNSVGDYLLTYTATDPSGNSHSQSRTVHVVDTTPPSISAAGADATVQCPEGPSFTAPTASDACDASAQVVLVDDVTTPGACPGLYSRTMSWKAVDASGNASNVVAQTITVVDTTPPVLGAAGADASLVCPASPVFIAPAASDGCDGSPVVFEVSDVTTPGACASSYSRTKTWRARDCSGNVSDPVSQTISVSDPTAPSAAITGPPSGTIVAVNATVTLQGVVGDNCGMGSAKWLLDSIQLPAGAIGAGGAVSTPYAFSQPGVYQIKLVATDECGNSTTASLTPEGFEWTIIVYDPNGGFVTGGGWINSPEGAYRPDVTLTGKANFGFVSKYQKGARGPTGETEFQFKAGNLNFHSSAYEWLVVAGAKAQYKGCGRINGAGDYGFMLTAIDGALQGTGSNPDRFRVKIWDRATSVVVYDNQFGQPEDSDASTDLGGGSIVVHNPRGNSMPLAMGPRTPITGAPGAPIESSAPVEFALHGARPNPFAGSTELAFDLPEASVVTIHVYDVRGRKVATVTDREWEAGRHAATWDGRGAGGERLQGGVYFARFTAKSMSGEGRLDSVRKLHLSR